MRNIFRKNLIIVSVIGVLIWIGICFWTGKREAWDASQFWNVGIGSWLLTSFIAGFFVPNQAVATGFATISLIPIALFTLNRAGPLMSVGIIVLLLLALACSFAAYLGSLLEKLTKH